MEHNPRGMLETGSLPREGIQVAENTAERLEEIGRALSSPPARRKRKPALVMRHIVGANLVGMISARRHPRSDLYRAHQVGHNRPRGALGHRQGIATTTVVDGSLGFGYVVNERAMRLTIEKAEKGNVAAATVFRQGHIGRLSSYTQMAAKAGMIGLITADSGRSPKAVAPFAGARRGSHQPHFDGDPVRSRRAALSRHGDLGGRQPARSRSPSRATSGCRMAGSSAATASDHDPSQLRQGGALLPLGGPMAATRAPGLPSWSRSCVGF